MLAHLLWAGVAVYAIHRITAVADAFAPTPVASTLPPPPVEEDPDQRRKVAEQLKAYRSKNARDFSHIRSADDNGRKPSPAPPVSNGEKGNGHF